VPTDDGPEGTVRNTVSSRSAESAGLSRYSADEGGGTSPSHSSTMEKTTDTHPWRRVLRICWRCAGTKHAAEAIDVRLYLMHKLACTLIKLLQWSGCNDSCRTRIKALECWIGNTRQRRRKSRYGAHACKQFVTSLLQSVSDYHDRVLLYKQPDEVVLRRFSTLGIPDIMKQGREQHPCQRPVSSPYFDKPVYEVPKQFDSARIVRVGRARCPSNNLAPWPTCVTSPHSIGDLPAIIRSTAKGLWQDNALCC